MPALNTPQSQEEEAKVIRTSITFPEDLMNSPGLKKAMRRRYTRSLSAYLTQLAIEDQKRADAEPSTTEAGS